MERGYCLCGNFRELSHRLKDGTPLYHATCRSCRGRSRYGIKKNSICERCGFVPIVAAQLHIDHVDGDRANNDKSNLMTLCSNCHSLKSFLSRDIRHVGEDNPFYGRTHSEDALVKIKEARTRQARSKK